ncbi:MAG: hypothetical protein NUV82_03980 [Candidatus Komeilibacteria bacterium]|nr:hypothetical protein [Candidatus Komeilibacteria bacterium]
MQYIEFKLRSGGSCFIRIRDLPLADIDVDLNVIDNEIVNGVIAQAVESKVAKDFRFAEKVIRKYKRPDLLERLYQACPRFSGDQPKKSKKAVK